MKLTAIIAKLTLVLLATAAYAAEPFFVDLAPVANTTLEYDGKEGWAGEGINDMFLYPPIPNGEVTRNGYRFKLADPSNGAKTVVLLKGRKLSSKPQSVDVAVPNVKGRFLYVLQNALASVDGQPANYRVATYVVKYADGSTAEIPVNDGIEIRRWYTGQWYENSGAKSWPIFVGRNAISSKWNQYVGVWAMQWQNPSADKPITSITLRSEGLATPAVFAITLTDDDYFNSPNVKQHYVRPEVPPADYFQGKLAHEQAALYDEMRARKLVQGMRRVEVIRPDVIAVTIDGAVARGAGLANDNAASFQKPDAFSVRSDGDAAYAAPTAPATVGRQSYEYWNGDIGRFSQNVIYWHTYYLKLLQPLKSGQSYTVAVRGLGADLTAAQVLVFDDRKTVTPVIKVNQVAYAASAKQRYAYVGWWAADLGAVDYSDLKRYEVIDESNGRCVFEGELAARRAEDALSGESIMQIDLSSLTTGRYHIVVPGLGRSDSFGVGGEGIKMLYYNTSRAFFHQRCGHALQSPFTTFHKDACHCEVYESGHLVGGRYMPKPGEQKHSFRGGYHDAADFDTFTYHLRATAQALTAYTFAPTKFKDRDLNIPESGNGIPDVLDEADWALFSYRDNQQPDGGVPLGRGNDEDAIREWERNHNGRRPAFGLFPPTHTSCTEYAAVAAQFARAIRPYDAAKADAYIDSARKAFAWAQSQPDSGKPEMGGDLFYAWAASELYAATGDKSFSDVFKKLYRGGVLKRVHWRLASVVPTCLLTYLNCTQPDADKTIQDELRQDLIRRADDVVKQTEAAPYRVGRGPAEKGNGWGNLNGGGYYADVCLRAYFLTREQKYLDAACLNADFQLGTNPLSKTFITGMGARPPEHPQISAFLYTGPGKTGSTVPGITIYGLTSDAPKWYPESIPSWRRWRDLGNGSAEVSSEFTITETIGFSAMLYQTLYAIESN